MHRLLPCRRCQLRNWLQDVRQALVRYGRRLSLRFRMVLLKLFDKGPLFKLRTLTVTYRLFVAAVMRHRLL